MKILRRTVVTLALLAVVLTAGSAAALAAPARPNVIFVTVDTLRADRLSGYGYDRPTSPNLDRLMHGGIRFSQARTIEPLTSPGLCSMVTSLDPHEHGSNRNGLRMRPGLDSLPKLLASSGYKTAAMVGAWPLRDKLSGLGEHFDEYHEVLNRKRWFGLFNGEATATDLTDQALDWVDSREGVSPGPFVLWIHYVEPHAPYKAHKQFLPALGISKKSNIPPADRYDTEVAFVDQEIGRFIDGMRERGLYDDTIWIFTSDHGESLGEHKYWGHGRHLYEPTLLVPMAVTWPARLRSRIIDAPALITDLAPTVAGLLELPVPSGFAGYDWSGVFRGEPTPSDRVTFYQAHRGAVLSRHGSELARRSGLLAVAVIRDGRKEIYRIKDRRHHEFDLADDPLEIRDLTAREADPTGEVQDWMRTVYTGLHQLDARPPEPLDNESIEQLRSLGYAD